MAKHEEVPMADFILKKAAKGIRFFQESLLMCSVVDEQEVKQPLCLELPSMVSLFYCTVDVTFVYSHC